MWSGSTGIASLEAAWLSGQREGMERLALTHKVILYDHRGQGLSDREVADFSLQARVNDLTAVVETAAEDAVDLIALGQSAMVTLAYAAGNADRVRRLALVAGAARGSEFRASAQHRAVRRLLEVDWEAYVQTITMLHFGWTELGRQVALVSADCVTPETYVAAQRALREYDVTDLLPRVICPTLVIRSRSDEMSGVSAAASKLLVAALPNGRLLIHEGLRGRVVDEELSEIIEAFLNEDDAPRRPEPVEVPSGTAIILFADIADSTALTERLGDAAFRAKARDLDAALRTVIRGNAGTPIEGKLLGDGVLAVFTGARQAIEAALACGAAGSHAGLPLHLGLHAGDVIREENNVYGGAVNIASRISGLSAPGEVLVSDIVRGLARTSAGVRFEDRGEQSLKGVGEKVRVWAVVEGEV